MNEVCPGCGRHCALNELHCERGREFARTGELPARSAHREGGHDGRDGHGGHGCHGRRGNALQGMEYRELPLESRIAAYVCELAHVLRRQEDREQAIALHREVFACLGEEEKNALLMCMEKVCRSLPHRD